VIEPFMANLKGFADSYSLHRLRLSEGADAKIVSSGVNDRLRDSQESASKCRDSAGRVTDSPYENRYCRGASAMRPLTLRYFDVLDLRESLDPVARSLRRAV